MERLVVSAHYATSANLNRAFLEPGGSRKEVYSVMERYTMGAPIGYCADIPEQGEELQLETLLLSSQKSRIQR